MLLLGVDSLWSGKLWGYRLSWLGVKGFWVVTSHILGSNGFLIATLPVKVFATFPDKSGNQNSIKRLRWSMA
jgi:hypothetical protein